MVSKLMNLKNRPKVIGCEFSSAPLYIAADAGASNDESVASIFL